MDYANSSSLGDVVLTYAAKNKPYNFLIGNHETWNGLEQISSSRFLSFMERAAFDDAFVNTRRLGISAGFVNKAGDMRLNVGMFTAHSIDSSLDNDGYIAAARAVYSPPGAQQRLAPNFQHRSSSRTLIHDPRGSGRQRVSAGSLPRAAFASSPTCVVATGTFAHRAITSSVSSRRSSVAARCGRAITNVDAYGAGPIVVEIRSPCSGIDAGTTTSGSRANGNPSFWGGFSKPALPTGKRAVQDVTGPHKVLSLQQGGWVVADHARSIISTSHQELTTL